MEKIKCLVTGGAGFIGSHLVDKLLSLGYEVIVIDNLRSGKKENLKNHENNPQLKIYVKDLREDINDLFKGVSIVFHVAAIPGVQYSIKFPEETNDVNVTGTLNVLEASRKAGVKRLVYSASSSAYGDQDRLPLVETMTPNPMSPYGLQKLIGEYYCKVYYSIYGLETVSLRYFNVFGPRQNPSGGYAGLIPKTINLSLTGKNPEIYGDGKHTRDFTYVRDVVEANILAGQTTNKKSFGQVFNIGGGTNFSVNEVIGEIYGDKKFVPITKPAVIEPKNSLSNTTKAKEILKWKPKYTFKEGIKETVSWFEEN